jgi:LacI family transcriptional regulator
MSQPDPYVRIALLMRPDSGFYRGVLRGIKRYAQQQRNWVFGMAARTQDLPTMLEVWKPAGVVAFVYVDEQVELLGELGIPLVSISNVDNRLAIPTVSVDDVAVGRTAAKYLIQRGFCQFGFVGFPRYLYSNEREQGFTEALIKEGYKPAIFHDSHWPDAASVWGWTSQNGIDQWLKDLPKPCALFAANDAISLRLSEICRQVNIRVPEEIALLGVDNDDLFCNLAHPQLSSVQIPLEQIGYETAWLLDQYIQGQPPEKSSIRLPPMNVQTRQSTDIKILEDPELAAAIQYIHDHAHEMISMDNVLDELQVSRRSLERKCRKALGRSPIQELIRVRVQLAQNLLSQTQLPIGRVAQQSGFTSAKQLSTMFHKKTGLTPTAYRQQFHAMRLSHE